MRRSRLFFLSGYYGYTYSLVFAADMYATVFKADPLDPARGQRYRQNVLLPGGSQDDIESLKVRMVVRTCHDNLICYHRISLADHPTRRHSSRSCLGHRPPKQVSERNVGRNVTLK